jgi:hypothetical protein
MTSGKTIERDLELKYKDQIERLRNLVKEGEENQKTMKQIISEIAGDLEKEEKVPLNQISTITTKILKDIVSRRYINECLDDKYKNTTRSENARKQNKNKPGHMTDGQGSEELVPLNHEIGEKETISIVGNDQITFESTENDVKVKPKDISMVSTNIVNSSSLEFLDEYGKNSDKNDSTKESIISDQMDEINQLREALRKSIQFNTAASSTKSSEKKNTFEVHVIEGEFSMKFHKMQKYLADLLSKIGSSGDVWLKFKYDIDEKEVIYADFGRLNKDDDNEHGIEHA